MRAGGTALKLALVGGACLLLAMLFWRAEAPSGVPSLPTRLALVLPDGLPEDNPHAQAWLDAAAETGFPMQVVRASELLRPGTPYRDAALILPDTVHRLMNDALIAAVERRVREGARLMLVHDAGVHGVDGRYLPRRSRLSEIAGVDYALYDQLGAETLRNEIVDVDEDIVDMLQMPPGKLMQRPVGDGAAPAGRAVASYYYGVQRYPVFVTRGRYAGQRLLHADGDLLVAGMRRVGAGVVMFVNLPLAELKLRTDGLLLHGLLRLYAQDVAQLPQLSPMPQARGALILNWHIDSSAALPVMESLQDSGALDQGPFSFHLTAGPDLDSPGDALGMDLPRNERMRSWVQRFAERGDEIGSHGGWIHNAFGRTVDRQAPALSASMIERNVQAVAAASGKPVREYSAPLGNHPAWVTSWLRDRGVLGYYFTGDIGMAPTRAYQGGVRGPDGIWSFPVLSSGMQAGFEEAHAAGVSQDDMAGWLRAVSDYCADRRTVRLLYFHPTGLDHYPRAFESWLQHTATLVHGGSLRWTTMAAHAAFANDRLAHEMEPRGRGLRPAPQGLPSGLPEPPELAPARAAGTTRPGSWPAAPASTPTARTGASPPAPPPSSTCSCRRGPPPSSPPPTPLPQATHEHSLHRRTSRPHLRRHAAGDHQDGSRAPCPARQRRAGVVGAHRPAPRDGRHAVRLLRHPPRARGAAGAAQRRPVAPQRAAARGAAARSSSGSGRAPCWCTATPPARSPRRRRRSTCRCRSATSRPACAPATRPSRFPRRRTAS